VHHWVVGEVVGPAYTSEGCTGIQHPIVIGFLRWPANTWIANQLKAQSRLNIARGLCPAPNVA
jgi:hypothetical protein